MTSKKTKPAKPAKPIPTQLERDEEAASFILNAIEAAHRIRYGGVSSVRIHYSKQRRAREGYALSIDTILDKEDVPRASVIAARIKRLEEPN